MSVQLQPSSEVISSVALLERYQAVRAFTARIVSSLSGEDRQIQSMPDASPTKWHMAHTSWFFESFILVPHLKGYQRFREEFNYLYNSYYNGIGAQFPRPLRGLVTRPSSAEIEEYRAFIDKHMETLLLDENHPALAKIAFLTELGTHHEQQHQELILSDIKHAFSLNPLFPAVYEASSATPLEEGAALEWIEFQEGLYHMGHEGEGFAYDNEGPSHKIWLDAFELADRPANNGDYLAFIEDGGYERADLWLSEGWAWVEETKQPHPLYWRGSPAEGFEQFTLSGLKKVNKAETLCHINFFEANAFASWASARLPTEAEWEIAARSLSGAGDLPTPERFHPSTPKKQKGLKQMLGDVWEWTSSSYAPYPGFIPLDGTAGEYNGKFMYNQYVLRGGSAITPSNHIRKTYRNFFPGFTKWQFSGIRLARRAKG